MQRLETTGAERGSRGGPSFFGTPRTSRSSYATGDRRPIGTNLLALLACLGPVLPLVVLATGCHTVPVTGRSAFNLYSLASVSQENELGRTAFADIVAESRIVATGPQAERVRRVMDRLVAVADDPGYQWDVVLIDDPGTANAFALPGGKMAVYSGILPICATDAGLAVVMGHELGHVVARHGTERMGQQIGIELLFQLFDTGQYEVLARQATSLAVQLPYGRKHESEADHIGLIYMARAGFDPREAPRFWERMSAGSGPGGPEILSTHPSHDTRIQRLEELLPEALEAWGKARRGN